MSQNMIEDVCVDSSSMFENGADSVGGARDVAGEVSVSDGASQDGPVGSEMLILARELVDRFEAGRPLWSVLDSRLEFAQGVHEGKVMVSRGRYSVAQPVDPSVLVPLPMPGESVCLNVGGGAMFGVVLDVAQGSDGRVELAWMVNASVRRESFPPAVLDVVATNIRTPDRDPSAKVLARMLNDAHRRHDAYVEGLVDEAATWALRNEICEVFELYLDAQGLEVPQRQWTARGTLTLEVTVDRSFRADEDDVKESITAEEVATALGIPEAALRGLEWEFDEAERD